MHETAVAEGIYLAIQAEAEKQQGRPVSAKISCGILNAVNDEILRFAFEAITKETECEGMVLEIEHKAMRGKCKVCGYEYDIELDKSGCPSCGSEEIELLPDAPLILETIEFDTE